MFCLQCVSTGNLGIVERFGKFVRTAEPGLNCIVWPVYRIQHTLSLRLQQLDVECETKTKDNVFVNVNVCVQYQVIQEKAKEACYELSDPVHQIRAYVFDVIRSAIPQMELDQAFASKGTVAQTLKDELIHAMSGFGFVIVEALVVDLTPDKRVRGAMNEINANKRLKEAVAEKAEANKILVVKAAEAQSESKYLGGVGVAKQRKAIVDGLKDSVSDFKEGVHGTKSNDIINLLLVNQYFDTLENIGKASSHSTLYVAHGPSAVVHIQNDFKSCLTGASMPR